MEGDSQEGHRLTRHPTTANKFSRIAKAGDIEAVAEFFRVHPFPRFGAIISTDTILVDEMDVLRTMKEVLELRINEIVQWILCKEVKVILEASLEWLKFSKARTRV